jgi:hypothetical protein
MFKYGPFLNLHGRQHWAVPSVPTLIKVLVRHKNLLKFPILFTFQKQVDCAVQGVENCLKGATTFGNLSLTS